MSEKMFILAAEPETLRALLHLPPEASVDHVWSDPARPGVVFFRCKNAGYPVREGAVIQAVTPMITSVPQSHAPGDVLYRFTYPFCARAPYAHV